MSTDELLTEVVRLAKVVGRRVAFTPPDAMDLAERVLELDRRLCAGDPMPEHWRMSIPRSTEGEALLDDVAVGEGDAGAHDDPEGAEAGDRDDAG